MSTASMPAPETASIPQGERETVKCFYCKMNQFRTESSKCRRCKRDVDPPQTADQLGGLANAFAQTLAPAPPLWPETDFEILHIVMADLLKELREKAHLSQRQLSVRMQTPRTWVSKLENARAFPTLGSLYRLCDALGITVAEFTMRVDQRRILATLARVAQESFVSTTTGAPSIWPSPQRPRSVALKRGDTECAKP